MHPYMLDDNRFTTIAGVGKSHLGVSVIGGAMWWHTTDGCRSRTYFIRRGHTYCTICFSH